jgi:predicted restriction endonuclease
MSIESFLQTFQNLNVARVGSRERPHKPALLLAIISAIEAGRTDGNRIVYDAELLTPRPPGYEPVVLIFPKSLLFHKLRK